MTTTNTTVNARVEKVVDGDTIRVTIEGASDDESLRILALDTEESKFYGGKPVTPWGKKAKERANSFFEIGETVQLEFPGNEDKDECIKKYRGSFGRLLVFVHKNGVDYQEIMIREGYSPYFTKYGYAQSEVLHKRYVEAERVAQAQRIGVWNQLEVNQSIIRNYQQLKTWWEYRANIIDKYREIKPQHDKLFNTRSDYATLLRKAESEDSVTIFSAIGPIKLIGKQSAIISIGSIKQPFNLYVPDIESDEAQEITNLLETRYISENETKPNRSYAYITGQLSTFRKKPQMVLENISQISDDMPTS